MAVSVRLLGLPFDPGVELNQFTNNLAGAGAIASFTGLVRSTADRPITALTLEHYPQLAQSQLTDLAQTAVERFELIAVTIIHRFGTLPVNEPIVQVMTASPHRQSAFDATNMIMDVLKTDAPFWKKEHFTDGDEWVDAKATDDSARAKWEK